jgi:hypothetical protein
MTDRNNNRTTCRVFLEKLSVKFMENAPNGSGFMDGKIFFPT